VANVLTFSAGVFNLSNNTGMVTNSAAMTNIAANATITFTR
jgi:hypothetical protein